MSSSVWWFAGARRSSSTAASSFGQKMPERFQTPRQEADFADIGLLDRRLSGRALSSAAPQTSGIPQNDRVISVVAAEPKLGQSIAQNRFASLGGERSAWPLPLWRHCSSGSSAVERLLTDK